MNDNLQKIAAVIVTCNRRQLLNACLDALLQQTRLPDRIYIIDNASTDGTETMLRDRGIPGDDRTVYMRLRQNTGGAGGFHEGMRRAVQDHMDWLWMMDDDACPDSRALESLLSVTPDRRTIYGSVAVDRDQDNEELCWPAVRPGLENAFSRQELQPLQPVHNIPFLGFFIHRDLVQAIGLPEKGYFILGDDMEYTERARAHGAGLYLVRDSVIHHPMPRRHVFTLLGRRFYNLVLPPWKKYYDVRNRIFIGKKYYGVRCWTQTLPGLIVRMIDSILHEPDRWRMFHAYTQGIFDGLTNRCGKRVLPG